MNVLTVAQQMMDRYYLNLKTDSDFLRLEHFKIEAIARRNSALETEYITAKFKGNSLLIDPAWSRPVTLKMEYDESEKIHFVCLPYPVFSLPYDDYGMGVQRINPRGVSSNFKRIKINQVYQLPQIKESGNDITYWWLEGDKIKFYNLPSILSVKHVIATVIPASNLEYDELVIPDGKVKEILDSGVDILMREYQARTGRIIMLNDKNPNPSDENANVSKGLKTS